MFFKLLKLAGIDVNAKIAELRADLTHTARSTGIIAGLFLGAGILGLMVLIVALIALYKWGELQHGIFVGLAIDAGVLIVFAIILVTIALWIAKKDGKTITPPNDGARTTPDRLPPAADASQSAESFASYRSSSAKAEDLVEPMFALLSGYFRWPQTGHLVTDSLLRQVGPRAQETTTEAVARAAELVRNGNRPTMLTVLGAAALIGWLIGHAAARDKVNQDPINHRSRRPARQFP